jgi:hypothetical protein
MEGASGRRRCCSACSSRSTCGGSGPVAGVMAAAEALVAEEPCGNWHRGREAGGLRHQGGGHAQGGAAARTWRSVRPLLPGT